MTAAEAELLAAYGTPKQGVGCIRCGDWGTVVVRSPGSLREEICPVDDCAAAERARQLRGTG